MTDDDTADRIANRFDTDADADDAQNGGNDSDAVDPNNSMNESSSWSGGGEWNPQSVSEAWTGNTVYLPGTLDAAFDDEFDRLKYVLDREIAKDRHYKPLVLALGLRELASMDADEIADELEAMLAGEIDEEIANGGDNGAG